MSKAADSVGGYERKSISVLSRGNLAALKGSQGIFRVGGAKCRKEDVHFRAVYVMETDDVSGG
jgi:hypothetical protein